MAYSFESEESSSGDLRVMAGQRQLTIPKGSLLADYLLEILNQQVLSGSTHGSATEHQPQMAVAPQNVSRPFLSVITRVVGDRLNLLRELFLCFAGQSDSDFEVICVGHKLDAQRAEELKIIIGELPERLKSKVRLSLCYEEGRTAPLNMGFSAAQGEYIVAVDDDDLVFGHYVETFAKLAKANPGKALRACVVRQGYEQAVTDHAPSGSRAAEAFENIYPPEYNVLSHLLDNYSPNFSIAFPAYLFRDFGMRFDHSLETAEDWDFAIRSIVISGVVSTTEIIGIYRWWRDRACSRTLSDQSQWRANHKKILKKLDSLPLLLPPGTVQVLAEIDGRLGDLLDAELTSTRLHRLRSEIYSIVNSRPWRIVKPFRYLEGLTKRQGWNGSEVAKLNDDDVVYVHQQIYKSWSWRLVGLLRKANRFRNRMKVSFR